MEILSIPQSRDEILRTFFVGGDGAGGGGGAQTPSPTSTMKASVKFCDFGGLDYLSQFSTDKSVSNLVT